MAFNHIPNNISVTEFLLRRLHGEDDNAVGVINGDSGETWTYGEVKKNIHKMGSALARRGVEKGDVVATIAANSLQHMTLIYAVPAIGAIMSGMNPLYTKEEIRHQLQDCTASYVFTSQEVLPKVIAAVKECPRVKEVLVIGSAEGFTSVNHFLADDGSSFPTVEFNGDEDVAFLPYSSGTTGLPKGVMLTHRALMIQLHLYADYTNYSTISERMCAVSMFPFYHIGGLGVCAVSLYQRCKAIFIGNFDFEAFLQLIEKNRIGCMVIPPSVLLRMAKDPLVDKYDVTSITHIVSGAAPISDILQAEINRRLNVQHIQQAYGLTEACGGTHSTRRDRPPPYGSAGAPHPMIPCKLVDPDTGKEVSEEGGRGEIWVKTPCVMKGYWRNPDKTRDTLDDEGWIHTGDVAYKDKDDNYYIVDRVKELIKYKGFQVAPAELEALILSHPDVADVAVIGLPDERAGEVPAAYVVVKDGRKEDAQTIIKHVQEYAAPYKHLRGGVHFRETIPKNLSGKILRRVIRDEVLKQWTNKAKL